MTKDYESGSMPQIIDHAQPADRAETKVILGDTAMSGAEIIQDQQLPEISMQRQETYADFDPLKKYYVDCGDDRSPTAASAQMLTDELDTDPEHFVRAFGGLYGVTRVLAVTIAAQYGEESLANYGDTIHDLARETKERIENSSNLVLGAHSAASNEGSPTELNTDSEKGLGCAYCAGICAVTGLCSDQYIVDLAKDETMMSLGSRELVDSISAANTFVANQFFTTGEPISRADINSAGLPVMILEGNHAPSSEVIVVLNFRGDRVSSPTKTNEAGIPQYDVDATIIAEALIKAYSELNLSPAILLQAIEHDARATRAALASSEDGKSAADMKVERYGDAQSAISYLSALTI